MRVKIFVLITLAAAAAVIALSQLISNNYVFFAGYTVLQFIVLATAWNILGGYTGYVNFGSAAFFAMGAYTTVFFHKLHPLPIPVLILIGGAVSGVVGLGMGYLTLRLRGAFFAIATLALAVVLATFVVRMRRGWTIRSSSSSHATSESSHGTARQARIRPRSFSSSERANSE